MLSNIADWRVKAYNGNGGFQWKAAASGEAEAREAALRTTTVRGQKAWRVEVHGPMGRVAIYKGGKEIK